MWKVTITLEVKGHVYGKVHCLEVINAKYNTKNNFNIL